MSVITIVQAQARTVLGKRACIITLLVTAINKIDLSSMFWIWSKKRKSKESNWKKEYEKRKVRARGKNILDTQNLGSRISVTERENGVLL